MMVIIIGDLMLLQYLVGYVILTSVWVLSVEFRGPSSQYQHTCINDIIHVMATTVLSWLAIGM